MSSLNPMKLLQMKAALDRFMQGHPKLQPFLDAVGQNALETGTVIEVLVTTAQGKRYSTNLRLSQQDMELVKEWKEWKESH